MFAYKKDGFRCVDNDYTAQPGETLSIEYLTEEQWINLIPERAIILAEQEKEKNNQSILSQISSLESTLLRPLRELNSTAVTDKSFAQAKIDSIEVQISVLRTQLIK